MSLTGAGSIPTGRVLFLSDTAKKQSPVNPTNAITSCRLRDRDNQKDGECEIRRPLSTRQVAPFVRGLINTMTHAKSPMQLREETPFTRMTAVAKKKTAKLSPVIGLDHRPGLVEHRNDGVNERSESSRLCGSFSHLLG